MSGRTGREDWRHPFRSDSAAESQLLDPLAQNTEPHYTLSPYAVMSILASRGRMLAAKDLFRRPFAGNVERDR